jgi:hypothetical protein
MGKPKRKSVQSENENLNPLPAPLQALQNLISKFNNRGVIIGGVAACLLGTPRFTVDLDAVILLSLDDLPRALNEAAQLGIPPQIADAEKFARINRILLIRHMSSCTDIDLSLGILPFEVEMVERSEYLDLGVIQLRLPATEDLIILKAVAHRPKDLDDIQSIVISHPDLDKKRIQHWVSQFGEVLNLPELSDQVLRLIDSATSI